MTEKHVFHTKNIAATAAGRINRGIINAACDARKSLCRQTETQAAGHNK